MPSTPSARRAAVRSLAALLSLLAASFALCAEGTATGDRVEQGRRIYTDGMLISGQPLRTKRSPGRCAKAPTAAASR